MKMHVTKVNANLLQQIVKNLENSELQAKNLTCMTVDVHGNLPDRQRFAN